MVLLDKKCEACGEDISDRGNRSNRCKKCQLDYRNLRRRVNYRKKHQLKPGQILRMNSIGWYKQKLGSPNPWVITDYGCGLNKNGEWPTKLVDGKRVIALPKWARCWSKDGKLSDKDTESHFNTALSEDEDKMITVVVRYNEETDETDIMEQFEHYLNPERIKQYNRLFDIVEEVESDVSSVVTLERYKGFDAYISICSKCTTTWVIGGESEKDENPEK